MKNKPKIFIVEDDEGIREVYSGAFEDGYDTQMFECGADFLQNFRKDRKSVV